MALNSDAIALKLSECKRPILEKKVFFSEGAIALCSLEQFYKEAGGDTTLAIFL